QRELVGAQGLDRAAQAHGLGLLRGHQAGGSRAGGKDVEKLATVQGHGALLSVLSRRPCRIASSSASGAAGLTRCWRKPAARARVMSAAVPYPGRATREHFAPLGCT